jgi:NAD(P)-dependent dehydrogenase (short-subunit alcohol dehydrogenase family)
MACRDTNKGDKAAEDIRKDNPNANIVVMKLDLSSLASVRQFVDKVFQQESQIDLLINNAGVMMCPKWKTEDGFEMQIGTNHLGMSYEIDFKNF